MGRLSGAGGTPGRIEKSMRRERTRGAGGKTAVLLAGSKTIAALLQLCLGLLFLAAPGASDGQQAVEKQRVTISRSFIAPESLKSVWDQSDVVALVDVLHGTTEGEQRAPSGGRRPASASVWTVLDVAVVEVFKGVDSAGQALTGGMRVVQPNAGVLETNSVIYEASEIPLSPQTRWVLFLARREGNLEIVWGPFGAFKLVEDKITGGSALGLDGRTLREFREELSRFK